MATAMTLNGKKLDAGGTVFTLDGRFHRIPESTAEYAASLQPDGSILMISHDPAGGSMFMVHFRIENGEQVTLANVNLKADDPAYLWFRRTDAQSGEVTEGTFGRRRPGLAELTRHILATYEEMRTREEIDPARVIAELGVVRYGSALTDAITTRYKDDQGRVLVTSYPQTSGLAEFNIIAADPAAQKEILVNSAGGVTLRDASGAATFATIPAQLAREAVALGSAINADNRQIDTEAREARAMALRIETAAHR